MDVAGAFAQKVAPRRQCGPPLERWGTLQHTYAALRDVVGVHPHSGLGPLGDGALPLEQARRLAGATHVERACGICLIWVSASSPAPCRFVSDVVGASRPVVLATFSGTLEFMANPCVAWRTAFKTRGSACERSGLDDIAARGGPLALAPLRSAHRWAPPAGFERGDALACAGSRSLGRLGGTGVGGARSRASQPCAGDGTADEVSTGRPRTCTRSSLRVWSRPAVGLRAGRCRWDGTLGAAPPTPPGRSADPIGGSADLGPWAAPLTSWRLHRASGPRRRPYGRLRRPQRRLRQPMGMGGSSDPFGRVRRPPGRLRIRTTPTTTTTTTTTTTHTTTTTPTTTGERAAHSATWSQVDRSTRPITSLVGLCTGSETQGGLRWEG